MPGPFGLGSLFGRSSTTSITSPLDLSGCVHWTVADDWDSTFGVLPDRSAYATNWHQAFGPDQPVLTVNGLQSGINALHFSSSDYLSNAVLGNILQAANAADIFLLLKLELDPPVAEVNCGLWGWDPNHPGITSYPYVDGKIYDYAGTALAGPYPPNPVTPAGSLSSPHMYEVISIAGEWKSFWNETLLATMVGVNAPHFGSATTLGRGDRISGSFLTNYLKGYIAEMFIYNRKLNATERALIASYRFAKYGF